MWRGKSLFERIRGRKRSGNFVSELTLAGWCFFIGGPMMMASVLLLTGIYPDGTIGFWTPAGGLVVSIILICLGIYKWRS